MSDPARAAAMLAHVAASLAAVGLGLLAGSAACRVCNDGLCSSRLAVTVRENEYAPLRSGHYVLSLGLDDATMQAECDVDAPRENVVCTPLEQGSLSAVVFDDDDGRRTELFITFEDPDPLPAFVSLRIEHDGVQVLDRSFDAEYELAEPGCDADCVFDRREFVLER